MLAPGLTLAVLIGPNAARAAGAPAEPYVWRNVVIGGGGFVTGIIFNPTEPGLAYLRTDIGGAYRWDATARSWQPLLDGLTRADTNLLGIESLATDPGEPRRVYLAAGTYTNPRVGDGEILRSADNGRTWQRTPLPIKLGANEIGRGNGERLAVDPNDHRILYFGTRLAGLWRSGDFGATWKRVESFPAVAGTEDNTARPPMPARSHFPPQTVGLVAVCFDARSGTPGRPTPTICVAASTSARSLFRSEDAGATWAPVPGQPTGLRPNHLVPASDGTIYVSYGREPGPNAMTDGAVWKLDPRTGTWTEITPVRPAAIGEQFGYAAVAVDAAHPATVMVTTLYRRNEIYRSTDAGQTWTALLGRAEWDHAAAPYTREMHPHWMADLEIDPFNPDHVIFSTGYGIWSTSDATAADSGRPTHWAFTDAGLEETVPLGLVSPPVGAHLLTGLGDIDGFRHDNLTASPAPEMYREPHFSNTESIDFAGGAPEIVVRSGTIRAPGPIPVRAAYSLDGGRSWKSLASEPPAPADIEARFGGAGQIAVAADGRAVVWTPRGSAPHLTRDWGHTWIACTGATAGLNVVADRVNPARCYAYDTQHGVLEVSTDGAATFTPAARGLPVLESNWYAPPGDLHAVPDREGDLWLAAADSLYHSIDGGATFARITTADQVFTVGFGRAAREGQYAAVFIFGSVDGRPGIFRSDDAGATWIQISDAGHQYGSTIHLTGDPRIFGRVYLAVSGRGVVYGDRAAP